MKKPWLFIQASWSVVDVKHSFTMQQEEVAAASAKLVCVARAGILHASLALCFQCFNFHW